ncbi:MAG: nucleotide exchange factor GrpE [Spirochaetaceae bacterium]|nr:MAG: nucleotide exchange factor GrpE [Spirochaetaceae bacterium]
MSQHGNENADKPRESIDTEATQAATVTEEVDVEQTEDTAAQTEGGDAPSPGEDGSVRISDLEARISALEAENSELKEQYLRKQADFENFRKRMQREKEDSAKFANKELLLDIIPVIDDFERAISSAKSTPDFASLYDGVILIEKQLTGMLERKWGLKRFDSVGTEFDPQHHEALTMENSDDVEHATVTDDFQKGYMLHDRVLRSAKVKVAMPAGPQTSEDEVDSE